MPKRQRSKPDSDKLSKALRVITSRYDNFTFATKLPDEIFEELGDHGLIIKPDARERIRHHLQEFEFLTRLQDQDFGPNYRYVLKRAQDDLSSLIAIAETLDEIPGHLWTYLTGEAGVNVPRAIDLIRCIRDQISILNDSVDGARKRKGPGLFVPRLLSHLEREFQRIVASQATNSRRTKKPDLIHFFESITSAIPRDPEAKKLNVAAIWRRMNEKRSAPKEGRKIWVGQVPPYLAQVTGKAKALSSIAPDRTRK